MENNKMSVEKTTKSEIGYTFTAIPTNLFYLLDNHCKSTLFTLIQASSYYAKEDGYFFLTKETLQELSGLSQNLLTATLDTLYIKGLICIRTIGKGRGRIANYYKVNFEEFKKYEGYTFEELKDPELKIETVKYKNNYQPQYIKDFLSQEKQGKEQGNSEGNTTCNTTCKGVRKEPCKGLCNTVTTNIYNIENKPNKENLDNIEDLNNIENLPIKENLNNTINREFNNGFNRDLNNNINNSKKEKDNIINNIIEKEKTDLVTDSKKESVPSEKDLPTDNIPTVTPSFEKNSISENCENEGLKPSFMDNPIVEKRSIPTDNTPTVIQEVKTLLEKCSTLKDLDKEYQNIKQRVPADVQTQASKIFEEIALKLLASPTLEESKLRKCSNLNDNSISNTSIPKDNESAGFGQEMTNPEVLTESSNTSIPSEKNFYEEEPENEDITTIPTLENTSAGNILNLNDNIENNTSIPKDIESSGNGQEMTNPEVLEDSKDSQVEKTPSFKSIYQEYLDKTESWKGLNTLDEVLDGWTSAKKSLVPITKFLTFEQRCKIDYLLNDVMTEIRHSKFNDYAA